MTGKGFGGHPLGSYPIFLIGQGGETLIARERQRELFTGKRTVLWAGTDREDSVPLGARSVTVRVNERKRIFRIDKRESLIR